MAAIQVIRLTEADWRAFAALRLRALAESVGTDDAQYVSEVGYSGTQWRRRLRAHAQFAVSEDDRLLGLIGAQRASAQSVYLYSLWTDPAARRRGVARTLLSAAVDWAREQRVRTVTLRVDPMNVAAHNAYIGLGFTFDQSGASTSSAARGRPPQSEDEVTMTLVLS
ncbi:ribosomal protein S18 acetylase RimI-like enzyme [Mycobacterium sp. MAA66]|uniref:GNAT family N-acetyltransferase n=1 Tax=Mycobacterium sp. MAA66 TaxID=3156297 RepID=UPI00351645A0